MHLSDIIFPVYPIKDYRKIWTNINILYIENEKDIYILDNRNLSGDTLGSRRLRVKNMPIYPLSTPIFNIKQLIKTASSSINKFIDSSGTLFDYNKDSYVPLKYHKIIRMEQGKGRLFIFIKEMACPIIMEGNISINYKYIGLLYLDEGIIPYELLEERKKHTRRKV